MPDIKPNITYTMTLSADEFKLIGLALAGKMNRKQEFFARELNFKMLQVRSAYLKDLKEACDGALERATEELETPEDTQKIDKTLREHNTGEPS